MSDNKYNLEEMDSFNTAGRLAALRQLLEAGAEFGPCGGNVNLHLHSFFSFNALGCSPCHIAWEARRKGLYAAAICDFDVLDGMEEFNEAGLLLGLRTAVHLETRTFAAHLGDVDINSPGEAGVAYFMGAGFAKNFQVDAEQNRTLDSFKRQARVRNIELIGRINAQLPQLALDLDRDVVPLTPAGNVTERHIISAYVDRAEAAFGPQKKENTFWSELLAKDAAAVDSLLCDRPALEEAARARLVKRGGIGYAQPTSKTFPAVDQFMQWVLSCRAIPMVAWLDGTGAGERNPRELLEPFLARGAAAVNIIPDRSWNLTDPHDRALKQAKFREFVAAADQLGLPINIGTEMNKRGLPFVDDLRGEFLAAFQEIFQRGARVMVGHSTLLRYADFSYIGEESEAEFGGDLGRKNRFFESVGGLAALDWERAERLKMAGPQRAFALVQDSVKAGNWVV